MWCWSCSSASLAVGDVLGEIPQVPIDLSLPIAQGELGRREFNGNLAVRQGLLLLHVHERVSRANDLLLVAQGLLRVLAGEEVEVGPADGERRVGDAKPHCRISIDAREATVAILEVNGVGDAVHQRLDQDRVFALHNLLDNLAREPAVSRGVTSYW